MDNQPLFLIFLPFSAVMSADDDLLITHEDLIFQFETWKVPTKSTCSCIHEV